MKKATRLVSVLMAMILCFSCMSVGVSAEYADYSHPAGYDALDHPYISAYQVGSMILDMIDDMLSQKEDLKGTLDVKVVSAFRYDLTSIDNAFDTLIRLYNHDLYSIGKGLLDLGDLENIKISSIKQAPKRGATGRTDLEVLVALFNFLNENKNLIGKVVDGKWNNGGIIKKWIDVNNMVGDVHAKIKEAIFNGLLGDAAEKGTAVATIDSTVDAMINEFVYNLLVKGDTIPSLEKVLVEGGMMKAPGIKNFSLNTISVYDLFRYVLRAAIQDFATPALTDLLSGNEDIWPLITGLLDIEVPETDKDGNPLTSEQKVDYMVADFLDLRNGALSKFIKVTDDGVSLTSNFQTLLSQLLETAKGLMGSLTSYDTVEKWDEEKLATLTEPQMLAYLVRTAVMSLVDFADIPLTMPVRQANGTVTEEPINGYALATYLMINVMADKLPENDYYAMIENYKAGKTTNALNPGQEPVLVRDATGKITKYVEPAAMKVIADFAYYYLNANTTMDIPQGLGFDETFQWIINWAIKQWGGLVRTDNLDLKTTPTLENMVVWKNLDILLWENVFNITWLPDDYVASFKDSKGAYTGNVTRSLLLDNLVYTLINLDMSQLNNILSMFNAYKGTIKGYPSSEWDMDVIDFILTFVKRILNGMMQSPNAVFNGTNIHALNDIVSKTEYDGKTNLRIMAENLCTLLPKYGEAILVSVLPFLADSLADMDQYEQNYGVFPNNGETYTVNDLREKLEEQKKSNQLSDDMMKDDDYFFFGSEDFAPLYKFYNYEDARKAANKFLARYDEETEKIAAGEMTEAERTTTQQDLDVITYRLGYYFNRMSLRPANITQLLRELNLAKEKYGYGAYGSATAHGSKNMSTDFTLKTWTYYNQVYNFANSVYKEYLLDDSGSVRQSKISAAREMLVMAQKLLKYFSGEADYSMLDRQISLALSVIMESLADANLYYADTIAELKKVYDLACAVDRGLDGDDQTLIDEATMSLEEAIENIVYKPQLAKTLTTGTVFDKINNIVYGVSEKTSNYFTFVRVLGVGIMVVTPGAGGNGTGTKIGLEVQDKIVQEYTVVVFGDIDGDCNADAMDANLVYAYYANLLPANYLSKHALMAADSNNDGSVDILDAYYLRQSGLSKFVVEQRGTAA